MDSFRQIWLKLRKLIVFMSLLTEVQGGSETKNKLRIASDLRPLFLMKMVENGRYDRYKGFVKDFCEELVNILGYQYELILPQDHHQSHLSRLNSSSSSGNWNGVFGMLIRNEVDLAFGETEMTMERSQVVDFSAPVLTTRFAILHKTRNESEIIDPPTSQMTIFAPFPLPVWIVFAILAVLYCAFVKMHGMRSRFTSFLPDLELRLSKKLAKYFFLTWAALLFVSYVSNYTALKVRLYSEESEQKFGSLVDVVSQREVKIGWVARGPVERFFRNTVNELYQKAYLRNIGRDWVSSDDEGVAKIIEENGRFAFIMDSLNADYEAQLDCSLYKVPQEFGPIRPIAVATPIGSPLRERINQAVLSLMEQGIIEALQRRWFTLPDLNCAQTRANQEHSKRASANVHEMSPVFIFAITGLFLATLLGLLELQISRRKSKKVTISSLSGIAKVKPPRARQHQQVEELLANKVNLEDNV